MSAPCQLLADDGGLAEVVHLLKVSRESGAHGANIPACDSKSWSRRYCFPFVTAWCEVVTHLSGGPLSPTHPVEQVRLGGAAPYWLGAAQLEAGGSCPMKLRGLLPPSEETPGASTYANRSEA